MPGIAAVRQWIRYHDRQLIMAAVLLLLGYWVLRGCLPELDPNHLPAELTNLIEKRYIKCIDAYAIWPGDRRQPECGTATVHVAGEGAVSDEEKAAGVTRAICYKVTVNNPSIYTGGAATTHDIQWFARTTSKVAILQNERWQVFPDQDILDEQRWNSHACPETFEVK